MMAELSPPSAKVEELLRAERAISPASDELRERIMRRARSALEQAPVVEPALRPRTRLVPVGAAMLAAVAVGVLLYPKWRAGADTSPTVSVTATDGPGRNEDHPPAPLTNDAPPAPSATGLAATPDKGHTSRRDDTAELHLMERARNALAQQDFPDAWSALMVHEHRFPHGRLTEEREALKVNALLGMGRRDDARRVAGEFRRRFPQSVLLARMEDILNRQ